jgi:hypothetical protein
MQPYFFNQLSPEQQAHMSEKWQENNYMIFLPDVDDTPTTDSEDNEPVEAETGTIEDVTVVLS